MGNVLRLLRRSAPEEPFKQFEKLDEHMQSIEICKMDMVRRQRTLVRWLYYVAWLLALGALIKVYIVTRSSSAQSLVKEHRVATLGFIVAFVIIYCLKRLIDWYYRVAHENKNFELENMRKEKQMLLEKIQDTEAFRVTRKIIGKYTPQSPKNQPSSPDSSGLRFRGTPHGNVAQSPVNAPRVLQQQQQQQPGAYPSPRPMLPPNSPPMRPGSGPMVPQMNRQSMPVVLPPPRLARPILPHDRSIVEKVVDYVVGDGPSNRYALICANCKNHNGMALKDEFEYIAFYCCYCRHPNPARRTRPFAPQLPAAAAGQTPVVTEPESDNDDKSAVEINECTDRESEQSESEPKLPTTGSQEERPPSAAADEPDQADLAEEEEPIDQAHDLNSMSKSSSEQNLTKPVHDSLANGDSGELDSMK